MDYSDVRLSENRVGWFDGTLRVENPTNRHLSALVQVHVYDGQENVGDLSGLTTLKPRSSSLVDLRSVDDYAEFTDTTVDLNPMG